MLTAPDGALKTKVSAPEEWEEVRVPGLVVPVKVPRSGKVLLGPL